jgi:hypothetical protein
MNTDWLDVSELLFALAQFAGLGLSLLILWEAAGALRALRVFLASRTKLEPKAPRKTLRSRIRFFFRLLFKR